MHVHDDSCTLFTSKDSTFEESDGLGGISVCRGNFKCSA